MKPTTLDISFWCFIGTRKTCSSLPTALLFPSPASISVKVPASSMGPALPRASEFKKCQQRLDDASVYTKCNRVNLEWEWWRQHSVVPTLFNSMDCSPPSSSVHEVSQVRILEWRAISYSRESSQSRDQSCIFCIGSWILTTAPPRMGERTLKRDKMCLPPSYTHSHFNGFGGLVQGLKHFTHS